MLYAKQTGQFHNVQLKLAAYQKQISVKGEFETKDEYSARVNKVKNEISNIVSITTQVKSVISFGKYNPDSEILPIESKSDLSSLNYSIRIPRNQAKQIKDNVTSLEGVQVVGLDEKGTPIPIGSKFTFHQRTYKYEKPSGQIAWAYLNKTVAGRKGVKNLAMTNNGRQLILAGGNELQIIDCGVGEIINSFIPHATDIVGIALSSDERHIATASNTEVKIWEWPDLGLTQSIEIEHPNISALTFSANGELAIASNYQILLYTMDSSNLYIAPPKSMMMTKTDVDAALKAMREDYDITKIEMDGIMFESYKTDYRTYLRELQKKMELFRTSRVAHFDEIISAWFVDRTSDVVSVSREGEFKLWNTSDLSEAGRWNYSQKEGIYWLEWEGVSGNGEHLLWEGNQILNVYQGLTPHNNLNVKWFGCLSYDAKIFATGYPVSMNDVNTGENIITFTDVTDIPQKAMFSSDGKTFVGVSDKGLISIWRIIFRRYEL